MELFVYLLYVVFVWSLACAIRSVSKWPHRGKLPPGPTPLPVIGNLLSLGPQAHKTLAAMARVYGPVISLRLGYITTVVISSATAAREVLQKYDLCFSDRAVPRGALACDHNLHSMVYRSVTDPRWRSLRKICNSHIFGAQSVAATQDLRRKKVEELLNAVRGCAISGAAVDVGQAAFTTTLNVLSNTMFSVDLADTRSEAAAEEFKALVFGIMSTVGEPNLADFFPIFKHVDFQGIRRRLADYTVRLDKILGRFIENRKSARKESKYHAENDVLDILLNIIEDDNDDAIDEIDMMHLLMDLFIAGTDTTSITLEWAMAELIHNPDILAKTRDEINQVIGKGNPIEEPDIARLPYLQAVVKETFRMHPSTPFLIPRRVREDAEIMGFVVSKGAQVLVNAFAIGRDPDTWDDPGLFTPERFLDSEVDVKGRHFELIPFGAGRRICPGYPLALRMLPLMLASLVRAFDWKPEGGVLPRNMDMEDALGHALRKAKPLRAIPTLIA